MALKVVPRNAVLIPDNAKLAFRGVIYDVYQWEQELYDGSTATFERLRRPDTMLLACIKDGKLIMIHDEQPGRSGVTRLPGGRVDPGESWEQAARRECREELGLSFRTLRLVQVFQPVTKIEWFVAIYLAIDLASQFQPQHDSGEKIAIKPMAFDAAKKAIVNDKDPLVASCAAFFAGINSLEDLQEAPEFQGKTIDR